MNYAVFKQLFEKIMHKYAIQEQFVRELFVLYGSHGQFTEVSQSQLANYVHLQANSLLQLITDLRLAAFADVSQAS